MNKMTTSSKILQVLIVAILLSTYQVQAESISEQAELCNAFEKTNIDKSLIRKMEQAAIYGSLYRIIPASSKVKFGVESFIGFVEAEFHDFDGGIALWHDQSEDDGMSMVKVSSYSLDSNDAFINDMLKSDVLFNVEQFPDILFISRHIHWLDSTSAILQGDLTLHGVTRQVQFNVQLIVIPGDEFDNMDRVLIEARTTVFRSDFGMNAYSAFVNDEVQLSMSVEAVRFKG